MSSKTCSRHLKKSSCFSFQTPQIITTWTAENLHRNILEFTLKKRKRKKMAAGSRLLHSSFVAVYFMFALSFITSKSHPSIYYRFIVVVLCHCCSLYFIIMFMGDFYLRCCSLEMFYYRIKLCKALWTFVLNSAKFIQFAHYSYLMSYVRVHWCCGWFEGKKAHKGKKEIIPKLSEGQVLPH